MILRLGSAETMIKFAVMIAIITAKKKYRAFNSSLFQRLLIYLVKKILNNGYCMMDYVVFPCHLCRLTIRKKLLLYQNPLKHTRRIQVLFWPLPDVSCLFINPTYFGDNCRVFRVWNCFNFANGCGKLWNF